MLDRTDQTLVAHTVGNGLGSIITENAVLGEVLRSTTGVGRTQGVRAGRIGDGDGRIQRILAVHLAKAGLHIVVPGCADDGQRSPAGAVAAVSVLKLTVHALGTIDDGAAGLVDSLDSLDALGVAHVDEQIAQRQLERKSFHFGSSKATPIISLKLIFSSSSTPRLKSETLLASAALT